MMKRTKTMVAAGGVALALAGTGAGVAIAQTSTPAPAPPNNSAPNPAAPTPAAPTPAAPNSATPKAHAPCARKHARGHMGRGLMGKVEHGEFTTHTTSGDKVLDVQRGTVSAVDAGTITVKSTDGFTATYTINPTTTVHKDKKAAQVSQIAVNDRVQLVAVKSGNTDTAQHIGDAGPAK